MNMSKDFFTSKQLMQILRRLFDESELRDLCFEIEVDYDSLSGQNKFDKSRELVSYALRHDIFSYLCIRVRALRPQLRLIDKTSSLEKLIRGNQLEEDSGFDEVLRLVIEIQKLNQQSGETDILDSNYETVGEKINIKRVYELIEDAWEDISLEPLNIIEQEYPKIGGFSSFQTAIRHIREIHKNKHKQLELNEKWRILRKLNELDKKQKDIYSEKMRDYEKNNPNYWSRDYYQDLRKQEKKYNEKDMEYTDFMIEYLSKHNAVVDSLNQLYEKLTIALDQLKQDIRRRFL